MPLLAVGGTNCGTSRVFEVNGPWPGGPIAISERALDRIRAAHGGGYPFVMIAFTNNPTTMWHRTSLTHEAHSPNDD